MDVVGVAGHEQETFRPGRFSAALTNRSLPFITGITTSVSNRWHLSLETIQDIQGLLAVLRGDDSVAFPPKNGLGQIPHLVVVLYQQNGFGPRQIHSVFFVGVVFFVASLQPEAGKP